MKVLFICNQNQNRSKTAEELFKGRFETRSAGLYNERPLTEKQLAWADIVLVMEDEQRAEIAKRFPKQYLQKRIISIDISDIYHFNQPELVSILERKVEGLFSTPAIR
ncbi:phosphotyrosine protein phosphatase [Candidatus Woesearchaeota archaeon]|nr:phosphotyrosine protein phosphatase [Candidatus Woesearchaeota archaeon]